ncbi:Peroxiredoxin [Mariniphaga anaerophila]|uniref:Peroxiredoxin n=1 Tax=Mariniphaga anaerophila TaxID=1484053 RepID=A0A1M5E290_9BACT|nr:redoxin domain-containing protein [Mariniphaga anaerophila]SHF73357.1 Peroxiredoxin [Mariniphaga anaerophila]
MLRAILIACFIFAGSVITAAPTIIKGNQKEYAGRQLRFFRYSNPVTQEKVPVFSLDVLENGSFSTDVLVEQTTFVFADFGVYHGMLFLEPGKTFNLLLPPLREKSFADSKNPYFQPVEFWFASESGETLNDHISAFDSRLNQLTDEHFNSLYFNRSKTVFDSIQISLENQFAEIKNPLFLLHKKLKLKAVEADALRLEADKTAPVFQGIETQFWNFPAFIQLFDKTFGSQLSFEARTLEGSSIRQAVASGNITFLKNFLEKKYNVKGSFSELALLKMLHDAFYSGDFSQQDISKLAGSATFLENKNSFVRETAKAVFEKLEFLKQGSKAPVICLKNTDGNRVCTNEIPEGKGKFKYLIFADTEMIICREHLKYLARTEEQFQKHLQIIVVLRKTDPIETKIFLDKANVPGIHLVDEKGEFIEKYRVKSFPTCFLLNENHEIVFQQTKAPLDGFEQQFGKFLQQELFERQRNQSR